MLIVLALTACPTLLLSTIIRILKIEPNHNWSSVLLFLDISSIVITLLSFTTHLVHALFIVICHSIVSLSHDNSRLSATLWLIHLSTHLIFLILICYRRNYTKSNLISLEYLLSPQPFYSFVVPWLTFSWQSPPPCSFIAYPLISTCHLSSLLSPVRNKIEIYLCRSCVRSLISYYYHRAPTVNFYRLHLLQTLLWTIAFTYLIYLLYFFILTIF